MMGKISPTSPSAYSFSSPSSSDLVLVKTSNSHFENGKYEQQNHHHTLHPRRLHPHKPHLSHKYCAHNLASSLIHCGPRLSYDADNHDNSTSNTNAVDNNDDVVDDTARFCAWKKPKTSQKNHGSTSIKPKKAAAVEPLGSDKQTFFYELELLKRCVGTNSVVQLIAWSCDLGVMVTEYPYMVSACKLNKSPRK